MSTPIVGASNIAQPAKCMICGAIIGHFALTWPDPGGPGSSFNQQEFQKLSQAIAAHMQKRAAEHASQPDAKRRASDQHGQALMAAATLGGNLTQAFLWRHFQLPEGARGFQEQIRGTVHAMTSRFKLTPEYADRLARAILRNLDQYVPAEPTSDMFEGQAVEDVKAALLALAARYEEGHPTEPATAAPNSSAESAIRPN